MCGHQISCCGSRFIKNVFLSFLALLFAPLHVNAAKLRRSGNVGSIFDEITNTPIQREWSGSLVSLYFQWKGREVCFPSVGDQVKKFEFFLAEIRSQSVTSKCPRVYEDLS